MQGLSRNFLHINPIWWMVFIFCCIAVLTFAASMPEHVPAYLQVHIEQPAQADGLTRLALHLSDPQGLPIDGAQIEPQAIMPAMVMQPPPTHIIANGFGNYLVELHLNMSGRWIITISAHAPSFIVPYKVLTLQVPSS
jgi:hypothetical protein